VSPKLGTRLRVGRRPGDRELVCVEWPSHWDLPVPLDPPDPCGCVWAYLPLHAVGSGLQFIFEPCDAHAPVDA